jgi:hypothetical protein
MPLKIKHIFRTDLDPNSSDWWSKDKVDKLNLNFSLLSGGGMSGPLGHLGVDGDFGLDGAQGPQGFQGPQGSQGFQGNQGISTWTEGRDSDFLTLFPNFQGDIEHQPLRVGLGHLYDEQLVINFEGPLHILHNHEQGGNYPSNLILNSPDALDFHFRLSPDGNSKKLEVGKLDSVSNNLILEYDLATMHYILHNSISNTNYLLELNQSNLIFRSTNNILGINDTNIITANGDFKYKPEAIEDRILVSLDSDGNALWKNKAEVFGTLPIGSIISITTDWFNNTNFYLDYDEIQETSSELNIIYGRGRVDTPFEGWYLCHGEIWTDGNIQYEVPNLNSFNYTVESNGGDQDEIPYGDNSRIIIGGIDLRTESTYQGGGEYSSTIIEETYDPDIYQIELTIGSGTFDVSRNVHIIYLKGLNYYWQTGEITQLPTSVITLSNVASNSDLACSNSDNIYKWTGGDTSWVNGSMSGILLYNFDEDVLEPANVGWYEKDNLARYWNGSSFSASAPCQITYAINLQTNIDVIALNGTLSGGNSYSINTPNFENATVLLNGGSNANAGWYREINDIFAWRRYWDGTQFLGERFELPYIYKAGIIGASTSNNANACNAAFPIPVYYLTSTQLVSGITEIHKINSSGAKVLVHLNWDGNTASGDKPLVGIYTQNAPANGSPYRSLTGDTTQDVTWRSTITTSSFLNTPIECIPPQPHLDFEIHSQTNGNISTGREYVFNLYGVPQVGHTVTLGIYGTSITYTIDANSAASMDAFGAAYATFLNNVTRSQWLAAGNYSYYQNNPAGFKPTATYNSQTNQLTFKMNYQNSISKPEVSD